MQVQGKHYRTIWLKPGDPEVVQIIDQRPLPHRFVVEDVTSVAAMARAIKEMHLRGAGLIGAAAGYGMYLAALEAPKTSLATFLAYLEEAGEKLKATRPTAVNLEWAVARQLKAIRERATSPAEGVKVALQEAEAIADEDAEFCRKIGEHGVRLIEAIYEKRATPSTSSPTATPAGSPSWTTAPPPPPSTRPKSGGSRSTSGSTRPAPATRGPGSPPGSCSSRASPTP